MLRLPALLLTASLSLSLFAPARAHADDALVPQFATLDRQSRQSSFTFDMNVTTALEQVNSRFARFDLHGQWIGDEGYGLYLTLPITQSLIDGSFETTAIGNAELGYTYNYYLREDIDLNVRAGVAWPTADDDGDARLVNDAGASGRITDAAMALGGATWLRASVSPMVRNGRVFVRLDLGVDVADDLTETVLVRGNLGAGVDTGPVAVTAEVNSIANVADEDSQTLHTAAIAARFDAGRDVSPMVSFSVPLESRRRGEAWTVGAGIQARF